MNELKRLLYDLIGLTENEFKTFYNQLEKKEYKAKTLVIKEGRKAKDLYFIESGFFRTFKNIEGKEFTTYFSCDNQFITVFDSFIYQTPSLEFLEAIEDSVVYKISFESLTQLYKESPNFEKFGRVLAEQNHLCTQQRVLTMQTKSAKKKYLDFIKNYDKKIVLRAPQYQIASFLGIAAESLSRIRKEVTIS
ncbi:Crp/Fnr family transcriptional regulator [Tenacibaculum mesophilum]|uniref:Crp/Fnr family transcriptional regulator n=1 Tax=Tenacibaculum mesophilum TaxID=104268 RepID=UPI0024931324|nr:Crp/Fnr family transcriptional regulator [Tenacibaculum mesophilum]